MTTYVFHIAAGFLLSFIGSLPIGMINMTVAESTLRKGLRSGLIVAAGASLVELLQAYVSVKFTSLFTDHPAVENAMQAGSVFVFIGLGLYFLFTPAARPASGDKKERGQASDFIKGMVISALNVLVFPYWVFYGTYLRTNGWLADPYSLPIFAAGVMLGTFFLLYLYALLSLRIVHSAKKIAQQTNRILAVIFFVFALVQIVRLSTF